ncbi:NADH-quinone oxidoreductase subunit NuoE [Devosia ginsengisoli]|uniref:NADH-quinone oxidoreductase subunit NuoE n=1 Tax=Devosia ginsengisoli TaxID=400770 RepID=A0A5B8LRJ8_9HYPH|nr:NADH-quinone oxidoreductase subunit NuoE [Devosia ginsengisoli]QDZ10335.1 NADH-quinone oxidoreductase subunit NuoE [Devosia ginsengisoli]
MVARRLADESVQPAAFAFTAENAKWAEWKIGLYPTGRQQSAVIPLLMRAQDQDGWVSRATIETIADMLSMAYIRVLEVATFYTQFQLQPVGSRAHIQVCGTTPCMLRGAGDLIDICKSKIHPDSHHLNADGTMSWEEVECAGACVNAPMVTIYHDTYEDLTAERFEEIVDAFAAGKGDTIKPGPQIDRLTSAAEGGRTTLLEKPSAKRTKFVPPPPPADAAAPVAAAPAPTTASKPKDVSEEAAPALKGTPKGAKVSQAKAEGERKAANASAKANGKPNKAMREDATGAESKAAKIDGGKAPGKATKAAPAVGAMTTSAAKGKAAKPAKAAPAEVNPVAEKGGSAPLFKAPKGTPDDLKLISGVGPVLEARLNALGITKWSQVAKFTAGDIAKVEDSLSFKGRVARDNWLAQAAALAKGGEAEYIRVFGKKPR